MPNRARSEDDQELKNGETPGEAEDINGSVNGRRTPWCERERRKLTGSGENGGKRIRDSESETADRQNGPSVRRRRSTADGLKEGQQRRPATDGGLTDVGYGGW